MSNLMDDQAGLTVLIADDTNTDRLILESIVKKEGHRVVSARDGEEAVEVYSRENPDIVLMDALMPKLDGFGAAREIKSLAGEKLVPIIFLTSLTDTESLVKCLDAGGDDFLSKPYNRVILQAKIKSFNRMREMHATMLSQRDQISLHNQNLIQEQTVAKQVFDNIAHSGCLDASNVKYYLSPLAVFNGDVLVATIRPSGSMLVLLGDFTGHGLPAAIGAMPLASTFYGMAQKGFSMNDILREINQKLQTILPVGVFCCATIIDVNFRCRRMKVWNGGLPECFIYRQEDASIEPIRSTHLPLGVLPNKDFKDDCLHFELEYGDKFFMWSDGIHESRNSEGDMFGEERLIQVFKDSQDSSNLFDNILGSVQDFVSGSTRDDDLSLIEVQMARPEDVQSASSSVSANGGRGLLGWNMSFEVKASSFRFFDPLPMLMNTLVEVPGLRQHSGSLYTILSELYSNALEHGILGLDSQLKETSDGFSEYYQMRSQGLDDIDKGFVRFYLDHHAEDEGGKLTVRVKDSGPGFKHSDLANDQPDSGSYSGRGVAVVRALCESLQFLDDGSEVEAIYVWNNH